jgi:4-diphosphocytidyl-2-C-methyl-D-erythritol kinase
LAGGVRQPTLSMISFPPCKINLGLSITAKRPDGYHSLETCFYPVPWTDVLEIIPAKKTTFTSSGNTIPGDHQENLCLKAYRVLSAEHRLPDVAIHLHKVIPTGAGLGGGSSDAAHTLRLLNSLFELNLSHEALLGYAASLGSDCAFFLQNKPMLGTGRGEILSPLNVTLTGKFIALVKPPIHVSTAEAYAGITPRAPLQEVRTILEASDWHSWKSALKNDFEPSVFTKHPAIQEIKQKLYESGATYASMSGSGSTVFGIYEQPVPVDFGPEYTTWSGFLH